ncbi:branched-chain amino acid ABC transporter substrate-binding protein [Deinococcus sp. KNUC1210]|uniref:branched-chain amino acid ABC transporter substrate-binding protein n=1 Tax=Deinococcus sp. KNUC1210 TaxID=2917691 RepID=UPI001EF0A7B6|nr:branched-chain amino acid ABC transporter substrate-binding protein [Deinococcus sp. KNUC1210]ULH14517.1 branched-chain amino acid ABC transporter substrate-binding protein [Deinococcus sp. KNUC1210]
MNNPTLQARPAAVVSLSRCFAAFGIMVALGVAHAVAATAKIAVMAPLSGSQIAIGTDVQQGAELALTQRQADFAKLGIDLQLTTLDDGGEAVRGVDQMAVALKDPAVLGLVGPVNSGVTLKVAESVSATPLAIISPTSVTDELTQQGWNYFSRIIAPNSAQANVAAQYIASSLHVGRVYIVSDNQTFGNGLAKQLQANLEVRKVTVVGFNGVAAATDPAALKFTLAQIVAAKPDLVFYAGTHEDGAALLRSIRAAGLKMLFMGGQSLDTPAFIRLAQDDAGGVMYVSGYGPVASFSNRFRFVEQFQAAYKHPPQIRSVFAYDAMNVMLDAVQNTFRANGGRLPTRAELIPAVRKVNLTAFRAVTGPISLSANGERLSTPMFVIGLDSKTLLQNVLYVSRYHSPR